MRNKKGNWLFTSESVTEGHPDKICDQISDSVLDAILEQDPTARVACETCTTTGMVLVMGEITTSAYVDIPSIVRNTVKEIGYNSSEMGFDSHSCSVLTSIDEQSPDIAMGVNESYEARHGGEKELDTGAGDQGMMFGYANDDTPELMPMPIALAHKLTIRLTEVRKNGADFLRPDGKSQVTVEYENDKVKRIDAVVISTQHSADVTLEFLEDYIKENVIKAVIPAELMDENTKIYINPTGRFVVGGPQGDSGLTGRKIIVDTYGGFARHGGGCFSGKDPTKVDRSACYMMRYIAKNIVASGIAAVKCRHIADGCIGKQKSRRVRSTHQPLRIPLHLFKICIRKHLVEKIPAGCRHHHLHLRIRKQLIQFIAACLRISSPVTVKSHGSGLPDPVALRPQSPK